MLVDTLAPTTRDDLAAGPPVHTDPVTVTLSASDEHGALGRVGRGRDPLPRGRRLLADRAPPSRSPATATHTVSYYSTDNAGNDEAVRTSATLTHRARRRPGASSDDAPAGWIEPPGDRDAHAGRARRCAPRGSSTAAPPRPAPASPVAAPADHSGDGVHVITYRSWAFGDVAEPTRTAVGAHRHDRRRRRATTRRPAGSSGPVTLTLAPSDASSGVAGTTWSLDGGAAQPGTSVPVSGDGTHTVTYFSTDNAGNAEAARTATVRIDGTAPQASCAKAGRWFKTASVTATIAAERRRVRRGQGGVPPRPGRLAAGRVRARQRRRARMRSATASPTSAAT